MADKYKHLEDGADFTAATINDRFETVFARTDPSFPMPVRAGLVNLLDKEDLATGALRHTQLPSMIGPSGTASADMIFTQNTPVRFADAFTIPVHWDFLMNFAPIEHGGDRLFQMEIPSVDLLDFATHNVSAIIVLANICVEKFVIDPNQDLGSAGVNEDTYAAEFIVSVRQEGSADFFQIKRSWRFVSPRITINTKTSTSSASTGKYAGLRSNTGGTEHYDDDTSQDVPIRIVLRKSDIELSPRTTAINAVRLEARCRVDGADSTSLLATTPAYFTVGKGNLTAIPVHAKV